MTPTEAFIGILSALTDTIREAGPEGCPSGPLYAAMMTTGMTLEQYQKVVDMLVKMGKVRLSGHVLYWVK